MLEIVNESQQKLLLERTSLKSNEIYSINKKFNDHMLNVGKLDKLSVPKELLIKINKQKNIRIWYSSKTSEDLNMYLYILNLIYKKNNNINVYAIDIYKQNNKYYSLSECSEEEIENLLQYKNKLSHKDLKTFSDIWDKLVEENADLRLIIDGKLTSLPLTYLTNKLLNKLSSYKEIEESKFISLFKIETSHLIDNYYTIEDIISKLIKEHKIIIKRKKLISNIKTNIIAINYNI